MPVQSLLASFPLWAVIAVFIVCAGVILVVGARLSRIADILADRTGLGEAVAGTVLLGASTSASGTVTSVVSAGSGNVDLSVSNALGGIAAQTVFLAVADITYRKANLEHAAASTSNLTQCTVLILLLAATVLAVQLPDVSLFAIHPLSIALVVIYLFGVRLSSRDRDAPMWQPKETTATRKDLPDDASQDHSLTRLVVGFVFLVLAICVAGYVVARAGADIAERTGIGESAVGALMTATATSLPELVTTLAAVRQGALQLAVGGIIGGNMFDVLFLTASDIAYRDGSILHAVDTQSTIWAMIGLIMTAVLLLGLIRRERHGIANIGFESALIIAIYVCAVAYTIL
jgi:cation:H+ antiporter